MIDGFGRIAGKVCAGVIAALALAQAANATSFTFNTAGGNDSLVSSKIFAATTGNSTLNVRVTGWHATATRYGYDAISTAQLGLFSPGLGVLAAGENYSDAEHQIDNVNGTDFVMLQFDQAVSLTGIGRTVFSMGFNPTDSGAAYKASSVGTTANWNQAIDLTQYGVYENTFTNLPGQSVPQGGSYSTAINTNVYSAVWLVSAAFTGADNDGFKLSQIRVNTNTPAAVPEPASWAMMIGGFGAVGAVMRRRRHAGAAIA